MAKNDSQTTDGTHQQTSATEGLASLDIGSIVRGLVQDLDDLRAGRLTLQKANAHARLAHEILRGITFVITAQKYLEGKAITLPSPGAKAKRSKGNTIDGNAL